MFLGISSIVDTCNICEKGTTDLNKEKNHFYQALHPESQLGPEGEKTCQKQNLLVQKYLPILLVKKYLQS